jgi:predicted secreted protein
MYRKSLVVCATLGAVAVFAAVAVPGIASSNARRTVGSLSEMRQAETPLLATLTGNAETTPGDADGAGAAAVSIDVLSATDAEACWDLRYGAIAAPAAAHIHRGAAGVSGPVVVPFASPGAASATGCIAIDPALAAEIVATPASFYVNVHNADFPAGALRGQLAAGPAPAGSEHLLPVPLRAYDSRNDAALKKVAAGTTRTVNLGTGLDGANVTHIAVPPGATGALVTLTVTRTEAPGGFLKLYSAAAPEPLTSATNWTSANADIATSTHVAVDATGSVKITAGGAGTDIIVDVIGFLY